MTSRFYLESFRPDGDNGDRGLSVGRLDDLTDDQCADLAVLAAKMVDDYSPGPVMIWWEHDPWGTHKLQNGILCF